ncbi:MAG: hypothetical protein ABSG37_03165 [Candidatus Limnocylindrales bacterium]
MARAKRTDRSEARRKYRAYLLAQQEAAAASAAAAGSAGSARGESPAAARGSRQKPEPAVTPGARLGIVGSARAAYRQPHYRDDIRNVGVVLRSNAIWPVLVICVISGAYAVARQVDVNDSIWVFMLQFVFFPVPLLPSMLAGFLAPRSTWLAGLIASLIATVTLIVVIAVRPEALSSSINLAALAAQQLPSALAFGALMGALSGWYKRFLSLTSVPRNRPSSRSGGGKQSGRSQQRRPATRG